MTLEASIEHLATRVEALTAAIERALAGAGPAEKPAPRRSKKKDPPAAPATPAPAPAPAAAAEEQDHISLQTMIDYAKALSQALGPKQGLVPALLKEYGCAKISELPVEKYSAFMASLEALREREFPANAPN